ncbi:MAG: hypothetical protein ABS36_17290 [Acidobacteria bacterium SCN 69-37]|nr:MAG: hypothetical protein ABS36_17290 [Acidobacteria bacterium SCN 69-37]
MTDAPRPRSAWFIGEGSLLARCADVYLTAGHAILGVASSDPAVVRWAGSHAIPVVPAGPGLAAHLAAQPFDYLFSIVNLEKLGPEILSAPRELAINFHDGPLPRYAGLNAPVWALLQGETSYGVTWHEMTAAVDAGRLLTQQTFEIPPHETTFGLNARCYEAGLTAFTTLVDDLVHDRLTPIAQDAGQRTVFGRHQRPETVGVIDWTAPAVEIDRLVRASDFGPYPNPFGVCRLVTAAGTAIVTSAEVDPAPGVPGQVDLADAGSLIIGTGAGRLRITGLGRPTGEPLPISVFAAEASVIPGSRLTLPHVLVPDVAARRHAVRAERDWLDTLASLDRLALPFASDTGQAAAPDDRTHVRAAIPANLAGLDHDAIVASVAAFLIRIGGRPSAVLPLAVAPPPQAGLPLLADRIPVAIDIAQPWSAVRDAVTAARRASASGTFFTDVCLRYPDRPGLRGFAAWRSHVVLDPDGHTTTRPDASLVVRPDTANGHMEWDASSGLYTTDALTRLHRLWMSFASRLVATDAPVAGVSLLDDETRTTLLETWNQTAAAYDAGPIHEQIERQALATPDAVALVASDVTLTYAELDARANRLARHLKTTGAAPGARIGVCLSRSADLVVSLIAILKSGAAYVPLDPDYPSDRLQFVAHDAAITAVIADDALASRFGDGMRVVSLSREAATIATLSSAPIGRTAAPDDLAYLIYTSGSTGTPKGVMLEHRQVANFFAGMDACVPHDVPGVWLAVTSISFDISVLELFWTLARGFTIVMYAGAAAAAHRVASTSTRPEPIDFSLFYFSADEGQDSGRKYRLLLEGATFADANGFSAVWTPERHFHAFGGLYPNPAVTGAAVAALTTRVGIRAGSCVLPLHHPLRVAEEWSVVDNISGGRVGIAFASGWQPNDFVLRPENYAERKRVLFESLETVRALWRGEAVTFTTPRGIEQAIQTLPRPIQPELPVWITAAGNPETFEAAARAGAGVLTHLLGQSVEELATKIAAYRAAWRATGREGAGHVVLMLHALVSDDDAFVRRTVRQPLMDYLRTSIDLVKPFAESFPTFAARASGQNPSEIFASLSEEDYDALVEHSFERYYETSGLFGRPETCLATIDRLKTIGVDEVACLIDFGVETDVVLANLPYLAALRHRANTTAPADESIADLLTRHAVTHLQCTPSMARMLLLDTDARAALRRLRAWFVGGEALPATLATDLCAAIPDGELWNMYGPTETTVWSTVARVMPPVETITVGRPIANTQIYILDEAQQPVPMGMSGDLYIGGDGVARGYWQRPELTAERFLPNPFVADGHARIYATGDVARYRDDGTIEFLGRRDQQVKIRGHRIELGEIEAALTALPDVREAVVVAREDREGDKRLVAYVVTTSGTPGDPTAIRAALAARMPDFLVPSHVVSLDAFPLTPNNKIDRRALPAVDDTPRTAHVPAEPGSDTERLVVEIWRDVLRVDRVGTHDNFFDIGGDSLLAAQVLNQLRQRVPQPVSLTDLFRFPTVHRLAERLDGTTTDTTVTQSVDRARARVDARRQQMETAAARRQALRSGRRE